MSPSSPVLLSAENLSKTYPGADSPALKDISIRVHRSEVFGFLGPNGAGKTTAISIMCTLLKPDTGSVSICGVDALHSPRSAKKALGLTPQEIALYPMLTARENLLYFGRMLGLKRKQLKAQVQESLELMALTEHADRQIRHFSGGMKRRANLAAAIVHKPKILFLDEPTVGIDAQSRKMILENLLQFAADGMTLIYTSHYMEEVQQICDRVCIIDHGEVICTGVPNQLVDENDDCDNLEDIFLKYTGRQLRD